MTAMAYIAGVLKGDGWCKQVIGLRVKDLDFSLAFADALNQVFGLNLVPKVDERGYWLIRVKNTNGKFDFLLQYKPQYSSEQCAWLKGLFDSEGNAQLINLREQSYARRIAFYSTNMETLNQACQYLSDLRITTRCRPMKNSAGHKGNKIVYELKVRSSKNNYSAFAEVISSSIERKRSVIDMIPSTYQINFSEHCRRAQLKGATIKHAKTMEVTLPKVVEGIRQLIKKGIKPTQENCRSIAGFNSVQRYFSQKELVKRAMSNT